jgi:hypothetical protein
LRRYIIQNILVENDSPGSAEYPIRQTDVPSGAEGLLTSVSRFSQPSTVKRINGGDYWIFVNPENDEILAQYKRDDEQDLIFMTEYVKDKTVLYD